MFIIKLLLFICLFAFGCAQEVSIPPHLIGVWKTCAPQYEDRYLKFTEHTLTYGIGNGEEVSHTIDKIAVKEGTGETAYTFHYKDAEGAKWTLTLTYRPDSGGTIQLQNKNDIWTKDKPGDSG